VLDTGYAVSVRKLHATLAARLRPDPDDVDVLDTDGDHILDFEAAHGTFICGLAHRLAPLLRIDPERVLDPRGWGDDLTVAIGMAQQRSPVVNCSFGGYTEDDRAPLALQEALRALGRNVVVVAAAGNNASDRPFWPAAFKRVIAVAALDTTVTPHRPARFSNYGWWVDVCAPGVDLQSAYVNGVWQLDPAHEAMTFAGWATWSGTSFAAPLVAATIAAKAVESGQPARQVAAALVAALGPVPGHPDHGLLFEPPTDLVHHAPGPPS
jgi:subtilisin family serine protease